MSSDRAVDEFYPDPGWAVVGVLLCGGWAAAGVMLPTATDTATTQAQGVVVLIGSGIFHKRTCSGACLVCQHFPLRSPIIEPPPIRVKFRGDLTKLPG